MVAHGSRSPVRGPAGNYEKVIVVRIYFVQSLVRIQCVTMFPVNCFFTGRCHVHFHAFLEQSEIREEYLHVLELISR